MLTGPDGPADAQAAAPDSTLALYRDLIAARRRLRGAVELLPAADDVLAYRRGDHAVALNTGDVARESPIGGELIRATHAGRRGAGSARAGHA